MVKKTVVSESPRKMIVLDFSNQDMPACTYTGEGWSGKDIRVALALVKRGYLKQRYTLAHNKGDVR
jgi:hypothetical protein